MDVKESFLVKEQDKDFLLAQDVTAYKDYAAESRYKDTLAANGRNYRSFAIIPDIVAIDILTKYRIDIHAKEFMSNPAEVAKLKRIIATDYPDLLTGNLKS